jgi:hypothetical protein
MKTEFSISDELILELKNAGDKVVLQNNKSPVRLI